MKMQRNTQYLLLCFLLGLASCAPDSLQDNIPDEPNGNPSTADFKAAFLDAVNAYRAAGCTCGVQFMPPTTPLQWNNLLTQAAQRHANDMFSKDFFSHTGSDGSSSSSRVTDTGYDWQGVGENIAFGYNDIEAVVDGWIASDGHCRNIMNRNFTEMGAAQKGKYWVQTFGKPR